jgi:hypothetical protein
MSANKTARTANYRGFPFEVHLKSSNLVLVPKATGDLGQPDRSLECSRKTARTASVVSCLLVKFM